MHGDAARGRRRKDGRCGRADDGQQRGEDERLHREEHAKARRAARVASVQPIHSDPPSSVAGSAQLSKHPSSAARSSGGRPPR